MSRAGTFLVPNHRSPMLKRTCAISCALGLCLPLASQRAPAFTAPPGYLTTYNNSMHKRHTYAQALGAFANARTQLISADWTGKTRGTLHELSLRRDTQYFDVLPHGIARSWSQVRIALGPSSHAGMSDRFARNFTATPTVVFAKPVQFQDSSGRPAPNQVWGGFNMRFPFQTPYPWSGGDDLCIDFQFVGGTLANSVPWNGGNWILLDGFSDYVTTPPRTRFMQNHPCKPYRSPRPAYFGAQIHTNGPLHPAPDTLDIDITIQDGSPATAHLGGLGTHGTSQGVPGFGCERLYLLQPLAAYSFVTDRNGAWRLPRKRVPFQTAMAGVEVFGQAAYVEPGTGAVSLTAGMAAVIQPRPAYTGYRHTMVHAPGVAPAAGKITTIFVPIVKIN